MRAVTKDKARQNLHMKGNGENKGTHPGSPCHSPAAFHFPGIGPTLQKEEFQKLSVELIYKTDCKVFGVFFFFLKKLKSNPVPSWLPPLGVLNFAAFYVCFSFVPLIF